jgi:hypothetical protein
VKGERGGQEVKYFGQRGIEREKAEYCGLN